MDKRKILATLSLLMLFILSCNFVAPQATIEPEPAPTLIATTILEPIFTPRSDLPQSEAAVPRVSVEQAKAALDSGAAVIVDVRSAQAFAAKRVAGSISIPLADIEINPTGLTLDKDQWIITYCT